MVLLFPLILNLALVPVLFAVKVTLSMHEPPPYFVNVSYSVIWTIDQDGEPLNQMFIVKEKPLKKPEKNLYGEPVDVNSTYGGLGSTTTGVVPVVFHTETEYNMVAYKEEQQNQGGYEHELGRSSGIQVSSNGTVLQTSITSLSYSASPTTSIPAIMTSAPSGLSTEPAMYSKPTPKSSDLGVILASVVGACVGLGALILIVYLLFIRPRLRKRFGAHMGLFQAPSMTMSSRTPQFASADPWDREEKALSGFSANGRWQRAFFVNKIPRSLRSIRPLSTGTAISRTTFATSAPSVSSGATQGHSLHTEGGARFVPLTDRQMELLYQIHNLKAQLIPSRNSEDFMAIMDEINILESLHDSEWALGKTDELPPGMGIE